MSARAGLFRNVELIARTLCQRVDRHLLADGRQLHPRHLAERAANDAKSAGPEVPFGQHANETTSPGFTDTDSASLPSQSIFSRTLCSPASTGTVTSSPGSDSSPQHAINQDLVLARTVAALAMPGAYDPQPRGRRHGLSIDQPVVRAPTRTRAGASEGRSPLLSAQ